MGRVSLRAMIPIVALAVLLMGLSTSPAPAQSIESGAIIGGAAGLLFGDGLGGALRGATLGAGVGAVTGRGHAADQARQDATRGALYGAGAGLLFGDGLSGVLQGGLYGGAIGGTIGGLRSR